MRIFRILVLLFFSFFFSLENSIAQGTLELTGVVMQNRKKAKGLIVRVMERNYVTDSTTTNTSGRFYLKLPLNKQYVIEFYAFGVIPKQISVSTVVPADFSNQNYNYDLVIEVEDMPFGLDLTGLVKPLARLEFNPNMAEFLYNPDYFVSKTEIDRIINQKISEQQTTISKVQAEINSLSPEARKSLGIDIIKYNSLKEVEQMRAEASALLQEARKMQVGGSSNKSIDNKSDKYFKDDSKSSNQISLQELENNINYRNALIAQEKIQLEVDRLNAKNKDDSLLIAQREAQLQQKEKEILLAQNELERSKQELLLKELQIKNKNFQLYSLIAGMLLLTLLVVLVVRQSAERKRTAKELTSKNRELEKLSIVASETDNGIVILTLDDKIEWYNHGLLRMINRSKQEFETEFGNSFSKIFNETTIQKLIHEILQNKVGNTFETRIQISEGVVYWIQVTMSLVYSSVDNTDKFVAIFTNINDLKKVQNELLESKNQIENQHKHIKDSIRYAQRIQKAMLHTQDDIGKYFNHFAISRPKDIVSGDFIWFAHLPSIENRAEKWIFAVVDCTGHGVPGAFMSMIGSRLLNEIVHMKQIHSPKKILTSLNNEINIALRQDSSDNDDGMDVCMCLFEKSDENEFIVTFAGAKRPLFHYISRKKQIEIHKGSIKGIGGASWQQMDETFENTVIYMEKNDTLYLTTDGIIDLASPDKKRFGTKQFTDQLKIMADLQLTEQKYLMEQSVDQYQQNADQRDDITLLALKLK